jgi:hypothetical protein
MRIAGKRLVGTVVVATAGVALSGCVPMPMATPAGTAPAPPQTQGETSKTSTQSSDESSTSKSKSTTTRETPQSRTPAPQNNGYPGCNPTSIGTQFSAYRDANNQRRSYDTEDGIVYDGALWLTNNSGKPCSLEGYGVENVQLPNEYPEEGSKLSNEVPARTMSPGPAAFTLAPGEMAQQYVRWHEPSAGRCTMSPTINFSVETPVKGPIYGGSAGSAFGNFSVPAGEMGSCAFKFDSSAFFRVQR